ncbi:hypothetical protein HY357_04030 [Candidatus Roizmanbacteria bacterium]|nr:hypothetical protein [Candidatus Roizmanbacteria bacterium]
MVFMWDYDINELKKTEEGRIKILERMINYGPDKGEKIKLSDVRKYWKQIHFKNVKTKRLLELLIWNEIFTPSPKSKQQEMGMNDMEWFAYCLKRGFKRFD